MSLEKDLLEMFLPEGILNHFEIISFKSMPTVSDLYDKRLIIELDELAIIPDEYSSYEYKNSGFMDSREINDFPIRSMMVSLKVRRRRWDVNIDGKVTKVTRDWKLISQGSSISVEYAAFLKEVCR